MSKPSAPRARPFDNSQILWGLNREVMPKIQEIVRYLGRLRQRSYLAEGVEVGGDGASVVTLDLLVPDPVILTPLGSTEPFDGAIVGGTSILIHYAPSSVARVAVDDRIVGWARSSVSTIDIGVLANSGAYTMDLIVTLWDPPP